MLSSLKKNILASIDHIIIATFLIFYQVRDRAFLIDKSGWGIYAFEVSKRVLFVAALVYLIAYFLIPKYLNKGKYYTFSLLFVFLLSAYTIPRIWMDIELNKTVLHLSQNFGDHIWYIMPNALLFISIAVGSSYIKKYYKQMQLVHQTELNHLDTELKYLKSQINPHTLFNTLNTLYGFIDKSNSKARDTLIRISDMLRYQLYESNTAYIEIEREIFYINSYIEIQKSRHGKNLNIKYCVKESCKDFKITPLILIVFIENAFKHISHYKDRANEINIELDRDNGQFNFVVSNTYEKTNTTIGPEGIGQRNSIRRLDLVYNSNYSININKNENLYSVNLKINIDETEMLNS